MAIYGDLFLVPPSLDPRVHSCHVWHECLHLLTFVSKSILPIWLRSDSWQSQIVSLAPCTVTARFHWVLGVVAAQYCLHFFIILHQTRQVWCGALVEVLQVECLLCEVTVPSLCLLVTEEVVFRTLAVLLTHHNLQLRRSSPFVCWWKIQILPIEHNKRQPPGNKWKEFVWLSIPSCLVRYQMSILWQYHLFQEWTVHTNSIPEVAAASSEGKHSCHDEGGQATKLLPSINRLREFLLKNYRRENPNDTSARRPKGIRYGIHREVWSKCHANRASAEKSSTSLVKPWCLTIPTTTCHLLALSWNTVNFEPESLTCIFWNLLSNQWTYCNSYSRTYVHNGKEKKRHFLQWCTLRHYLESVQFLLLPK